MLYTKITSHDTEKVTHENAVNRLTAENEELSKEIATLTKKITDLSQHVETLKASQ